MVSLVPNASWRKSSLAVFLSIHVLLISSINAEESESQPAERNKHRASTVKLLGRRDAAVLTSHIKNKYRFLKDIHIQNDENAFSCLFT